ncbi:MAG: HD-GYP domain-containing protein [Candidatus Hydrogenedentes bacterium]|nr:HD-GYP domain-containing protein [Candidatus Hydrogenedentota bacterium]
MLGSSVSDFAEKKRSINDKDKRLMKLTLECPRLLMSTCSEPRIMNIHSHGAYLAYEERLAQRIQTTLSRSLNRNLWKRILWRLGLAVLGFVLVGSVLLEYLRYLFPRINEMPFVIFLTVTFLLCPIIVISVRHVLALLVELQMAHVELLVILGNVVAMRDQDTGEHNLRVAIMAVRLAEAAKVAPKLVWGLFMGAFLHDVGKIGVPDNILLKPGCFTDKERLEMQKHVLHGYDIVASSEWLQGAARVVRFHHEKFDGTGYPDGTGAGDIPIEARIFSIVDVFDALVSSRPYKDAMSLNQALEVMEKERGTSFDPDFLDAFLPIAGTLYDQVIESGLDQHKEMGAAIIERYSGQ